MHAVSIKKDISGLLITVGNIPRTISKVSSVFYKAWLHNSGQGKWAPPLFS